jgi:EAL and modified HD-GYP domain-containing signal transduction protein
MHEKFIARQPIFDKRLRVFAYELLFRGGPQNAFQPSPYSSPSVIADSITLSDLQMLTGNARAFVNVDELALRLGAARLLPADRIVVEVLETVRPCEENVRHCRELRDAGYILALDDFIDTPEMEPLVQLAHFLKVDFQQLDRNGREQVARKYRTSSISLLAEKVETENELSEARQLGYGYFQGYFFCRPSMIETRNIPGNKRIHLRLLGAVASSVLNYATIEEMLKREPSLLYRLLRYLNSPVLRLRVEVRSVREAFTLLGEEEFRRWVAIFAIVAMSSGKPPELIRTALTRAFFCEEVAVAAGLGSSKATLFIMGLLSITDALLDKPIFAVLRTLPVAEEVKTALNGEQNRLRDVYELLLCFERADWPQLAVLVRRLGCPEESVPASYQTAIQKALAFSA